jgi:hypothetical protein
MRVQQVWLQNLAAFRLEARFAVVRSSIAAAPISPVFVHGAAEVENALVKNLRVAASHQLRVQLCNEKEKGKIC